MRTALTALAAGIALLALAAAWFAWGNHRAGVIRAEREEKKAERVEELLAECRTYSDVTLGAPDWARAEAACQRVMELAPMHPEMTVLVRRISRLRACEQTWLSGVEAEGKRDTERAVEAYGRLSKDCEVYVLRAIPRVRSLFPAALERATASCDGGVCEAVARLECQHRSLSDVPAFASFLAAHPGWQCPEWPAFRPPPPAIDARSEGRAALRAQYQDPAVAEAVVLYFDGDLAGARGGFAAVLGDASRRASHPLVRQLDEKVERVGKLLQELLFELKSSAPNWSRIEKNAQEALTLDELLLAAQTLSSSTRQEVVRRVSRGAYEFGKQRADVKDFRGACLAWKAGSRFTRSDLDLLKALTNVCTRKAANALDTASSCDDLDRALEFAVDGDGYRERVQEERARLGCPQ